MKDLESQLELCSRPTNEKGRELADRMNRHHFPLTSWGLEIARVSETDVILDIGCGGGRTIARLAERAAGGRVFGIDHSPDCVNWSKDYNRALVQAGRVEVYKAGVEKMPFPDRFFDLVTAIETIYFWPSIGDSFREVCRIIKPGGSFLIVNEMYINDEFREKNEEYMSTGKMTVYSPEELRISLEQAAFGKISIDLIAAKNWLRCLAIR